MDTDISAATPLSCSLAGEPGQLPSFPGGCPGHYLQGHRSRAPAPEGVLILLTWRGPDSRAWGGALPPRAQDKAGCQGLKPTVPSRTCLKGEVTNPTGCGSNWCLRDFQSRA